MPDSVLDNSSAPGRVTLVGAGPGSPDLITVRGLRCLQTADAVLHDALIAPELLREARPDAVILHVGKRGYCIGSTTQETIHEALVRLARQGLNVCRLKGGDPCLFGRGGEEAEALVEAGIPFEIIPGVTSALGATAAAGIPLTHRDVGQSMTFATGHYDPDSPDCTLDFAALAKMPVVVFYMAVRNLGAIAAKLIDNGLSPTTPAAILENGTLDHQRTVVGELATIGEQALSEHIAAPALFVVGEVVRYREKLLGLSASPTVRNETPPPNSSPQRGRLIQPRAEALGRDAHGLRPEGADVSSADHAGPFGAEGYGPSFPGLPPWAK